MGAAEIGYWVLVLYILFYNKMNICFSGFVFILVTNKRLVLCLDRVSRRVARENNLVINSETNSETT